MRMNRRLRKLILVLTGITPLVFFVAAQAEHSGSPPAYLPAVFGAVAGPTITPGPPTATATPIATPDPGHFTDCAFRTGNNAMIAITADVPITGGFKLEAGDEIAVFSPSGTLCAGMTPWSGKNTALTAWGDDSQTDAVDGLLAGEMMKFRIWDRSAGKELSVSEVTYAKGDGIYQTDSIHVVSRFTMSGP